jgi:endonuclease III
VEKIVQIGLDRFKTTKRIFIKFSKIEKADKLLNDIEENPHVFVLACLMDRQIQAEKAWGIPQIVFDELGTHDIKKLAKSSKEKYVDIFRKFKPHRFNIDMAVIFYEGIQDIINKYQGDASKIWENKPSSATVVFRFLEFSGCGIKIATMATNILTRDFLIELSDLYSIDISPDTHIKRVMARMGFVKHDPTPEMVIYKARELYPKFPGVIDFSCWEIGKTWCKPSIPDCAHCIVNSDCKRVIE